MKDFLFKFKASIRFIVVMTTSREFAFLYALLGTTAQVAHTYYLTSNISSFDNGFKVVQAVLLSLFISTSLLYYTCVSDDADTPESKKNRLAVNIFACIEISINLYYYTRHLIIDAKHIQIFDFLFATIISVFIPITIKLYANHIRAKEWLTEFEQEKTDIVVDDDGVRITVEDTEYRIDSETFQKIVDYKKYGIDAQAELMKRLNDEVKIQHDEWTKNYLVPELEKLAKKTDASIQQITDVKADEFVAEINDIVDKKLFELPNENVISEDIILEIIKPMVDTFNQELLNIKDIMLTEKQVASKIQFLFNREFEKSNISVDANIAKIFEKNKDLFLKQFSDKCKLIYNETFKKQ